MVGNPTFYSLYLTLVPRLSIREKRGFYYVSRDTFSTYKGNTFKGKVTNFPLSNLACLEKKQLYLPTVALTNLGIDHECSEYQ